VFGVFVSRFLPGVRAAVTPFAGVVGMSPVRALVPAATASAIWYAAIVTAASALGLSWPTIRTLVDRVNAGLTVLACAAVLAAGVWLWRRTRA
jgi:membrane protein DedA with SNARE-associated domain